MTKTATRRALFVLTLAAAAVPLGRGLVACNDNPLVEPPACAPGGCTCDEDPTQATCKAFNEREEGGKDPADATPVNPTSDSGPEPDAGEGDADAEADGG
ncbi:MAG: hypothetical protein JWP97_3452 [Labilithrix sp.]|nr:hypothetical protein [Labilithrix sp.]